MGIKQGLENDMLNLQSLASPVDQKQYVVQRLASSMSTDSSTQQTISTVLDSSIGGLLQQTVPLMVDPKGVSTLRVNSLREGWDFVNGFKDGNVRVTGTKSKLFMCNSNISNADYVFYRNYMEYFSDQATMDFYFSPTNAFTSIVAIANDVKTSLKWPYNVFYNCYWTIEDLYTPFLNQDTPSLLSP
jgi:hypothetical protein